jgi:hypothetical protein
MKRPNATITKEQYQLLIDALDEKATFEKDEKLKRKLQNLRDVFTHEVDYSIDIASKKATNFVLEIKCLTLRW